MSLRAWIDKLLGHSSEPPPGRPHDDLTNPTVPQKSPQELDREREQGREAIQEHERAQDEPGSPPLDA